MFNLKTITMKKLILGIALLGTFLIGFGSSSIVKAACVTTTINCGNGKGTIFHTCGTAKEIAEDVQIAVEVTC